MGVANPKKSGVLEQYIFSKDLECFDWVKGVSTRQRDVWPGVIDIVDKMA